MGQFQFEDGEDGVDLRKIEFTVCQWVLTKDFSYTTDAGEKITITKGLQTDLASTPRIIWNLYPPFGLYLGAAVLHDCLYTRQTYDKNKCDLIFLEAMKAEKVGWWSRNVIYEGVHLFGSVAWNNHKRENQQKTGGGNNAIH